MNDIITREDMQLSSLEELFEVAEQCGELTMFSHKAKKEYKIIIEFETIPGVHLKANGGYQPAISTALIEAMHNANKIRSQFK